MEAVKQLQKNVSTIKKEKNHTIKDDNCDGYEKGTLCKY